MDRHWLKLLLIISIDLVFLAGCALIPLELQAEPGQVLFQDNFSSRDGGWSSDITVSGVTDYLGESYRILVLSPDTDRLAQPGLSLADVHLQVESTRIAGPDNNRFGLICRLQDANNYYALLISSDGYYAIVKMQQGQTIVLGAETMQRDERLLPGQATHVLEAICQAQQLSLRVDGFELLRVQDADFERGDVGLIAGTFSESGTEILFDNFQVLQP
jgi:hypothetical protein